MKKTMTSLATFLIMSLTMQAQMDGVSYEKMNVSESLKEYEIAYFDNKPAITGRSGIRIESDYASLFVIKYLFEQDFMAEDSLLSASQVANKQGWYAEYRRRLGKDQTDEDKKMMLAYQFDDKLRELLQANFKTELVDRFLGSAPKRTTGKFTTWSGSANQFEIKKAYDDFLKSKTFSKIKKDLNSFSFIDHLVYVTSGVVGNYDFDKGTLQLMISTENVNLWKKLEGNHGSTLQCTVEMKEDEAQAMVERKYYRALMSVTPSPIDITTLNEFLADKEPLTDRRRFMMELNGDEIETIGYQNAEEKLMTIDINSCITR